jgi:hypothetical protein
MSDNTETAPAPTFIKESWSKEIHDGAEFRKRFPNYSILSISHEVLGAQNHFMYIFANTQGYFSVDTNSASQNTIDFLFENMSDKMLMEAYFKSLGSADNGASGAQSSN